ncbi:MAG: MG2 domain-containing protein, partial [Flavobacteriaceae bacterium]|nr:MG2 domain-containing protein [Flavobacteriaceae bacterium]
VSNFDVAGMQLQKGLKGFIYTERGVYRPGDSIHLNFVINDKNNPLPDDHPVVLELTDARGSLVYKSLASQRLNKTFYFPIPTQASAPTGNWNATVNVGAAKFTKTIPIATIKPNRLKLRLSTDEEVQDVASPFSGALQVSWLHGAPARNLKVAMDASIRGGSSTFPKFKEFTFYDPVRSFNEIEIPILNEKLDNEGILKFKKNLEISNNAPGMLKMTLVTKAFEGGGDFSIDVFSKDIAPFSHFVGLKVPKTHSYNAYFTDQEVNFEAVAVDKSGNAVAHRNLIVKVYKIEWRWWWSRGRDNLSTYENASIHKPVKEYNLVTDISGKASFDLNIDENQGGRYLIRVFDNESGHATGSVVYFYKNWWQRDLNNNNDGAKLLIFSADKEKYQVGETAVISFPSSENAKALLSIENGTEVLQTQWIDTQKGQTKVELKLTEVMAPNVFVNISLIQPHHKTENNLPIRMYGIIPLLVENPATRLDPELKIAETLTPEGQVNIQVSEKHNRAMTYTIAVVDEGLLDLTRFKSPDIHQAFYTREALGVKTFDMYDEVIGAYSGSVENIYTVGGGDEAVGAKKRKADRFKPVVKHIGPFYLEAGKTANHQFNMPNYIGSVRCMLIASNHQKVAYGSTEKTSAVKKPLMVLASLPRKLSPGETVRLPVTVFAMDKKIKNVQVNV